MSPERQTYANHRHQPTMAGLLFLFAVVALVSSVIALFRRPDALGIAALALSLAMIVVAGIAREYIVRLQDRIIRTEMRMRVAARWPERLAELERITMKQLVALRFASDPELPGLLDRAVNESLAPNEIKKAIRDWVPDHYRT